MDILAAEGCVENKSTWCSKVSAATIPVIPSLIFLGQLTVHKATHSKQVIQS